MNQRRQVAIVAGLATLLATMPLSTVFANWTWLIDCLLMIGAVTGVGIGSRALRAPVWGQFLAMSAAVLLMLTFMFPMDGTIGGLIPTAGTFAGFGDLIGTSGQDMRSLALPVPDRDSLLFLTTLGIGAVAVVVDVVAVGLRRPALAGLPMLAIYAVPVAVHSDSVSVIPFIFGAVGFLWLLITDNVDRVRRFGRRFTGDGRDVDVWEPSPVAAAGRRLAVVGVLAAVLLPVAVPGLGSSVLERFATSTGTGDGTGNGPGNGSSVDMFANLSGYLNQDEGVDMVKVTTNDPNPFYLRLGVADDLTSNGFRESAPTSTQPVGNLPGPTAPTITGVTQAAHHAKVEILTLNMGLLPLYTQPTKTEKIEGSWLYDPGKSTIFSRKTRSKGKQYEFDYTRMEYTPAALQTARSLRPDDPIQQRYTQVPSVPAEVRTLVGGLAANKTRPYDKVRALYDHFSMRNGFTYSLSTESANSGSAIADFLTTKKGYCVQYAAALGWLVRAAGVPARVAFGFTRGGSIDGSTATLDSLNLHAWTEVYFSGFGWVPFDATPSTGIAGSARSTWAPDVDAPAADVGGGGRDADGDPAAPGAGPSASAAADDLDRGENQVGTAADGGTRQERWPVGTVAVLLGVLALLAAPALLRSRLRRRRLTTGGTGRLAGSAAVGGQRRPDGASTGGGTSTPAVAGNVSPTPVDPELRRHTERRRAHAAWEELLDTLVDHRVLVDASETPRATADRLVRTLHLSGGAATATRSLSRAEERARYAREPLAGNDLPDDLVTVRRALRSYVSMRTRVLATVLPLSTLRRGRAGMLGGLTTASNWLARVRGRVVAAVVPQRLLAGRARR